MSEPVGVEEPQTTETMFDSPRKLGLTLASDFLATVGLFSAELARFRNVNFDGIKSYMATHPDWNPAYIGQPWFAFLQKCGDIAPGFLASAISFWAIEGVNATMRREIPEKIKVLLAVVLGIGAIGAHEGGMLFQQPYSNGNLPDILVGALGPIAYGGMRLLLENLTRDTGEKIDEIELEQAAIGARMSN